MVDWLADIVVASKFLAAAAEIQTAVAVRCKSGHLFDKWGLAVDIEPAYDVSAVSVGTRDADDRVDVGCCLLATKLWFFAVRTAAALLGPHAVAVDSRTLHLCLNSNGSVYEVLRLHSDPTRND